MKPKYDIEVSLLGQNGNAFHIIGAVSHELRKHKVPGDEINKFYAQAISGDYNNLLNVVQEWVHVT